MMILLLFGVVMTTLTIFSQESLSQVINPPELVNEFMENEYTIKEFYYPFSRDCDEYGRQFQIFLNDEILVKSRIWQFMGMWNFCYNTRQNSPECYFKDINGDSKDEVIFGYASGGNDGREDTEIYSIDSTAAKRIAFFDGLEKCAGSIWINDLDNDSIGELIVNSRHYECWKAGCAGSRAPLLVWKWDGERYRMANKKLSEQILRVINKIDPDSVVGRFVASDDRISKGEYDPKDWDKYPLWLLGIMLDLIYVGEDVKADSVFEICWPDSILYKREFYIEAKTRVKLDPFWPEIVESDW